MRGSEATGSHPRWHTTTLLCFFRDDRESVVYVYLRLLRTYGRDMCVCMCVCVYSLRRRALKTSNDTLRDVSTPKKAPLVGREEEEEEGGKGGGDGFPGVAADC